MAGNLTKAAATEEVEMQMTPMIDVTFLLLIFFLCSIKFKLLDGKMQTYLPKDLGVNTAPVITEMEKIDVNLKIDSKSPLGFSIDINGRAVRDLTQFFQEVRRLHQSSADLKCTIYPYDKVQYGHVIKVVNECLRADMNQISFGAAPTE
ncbi:MAG: biopolymer transporter ExbD [Planctomycetes bacterium]|nr:biopolymer transporter ExbD [Planctomycetota bacterium]